MGKLIGPTGSPSGARLRRTAAQSARDSPREEHALHAERGVPELLAVGTREDGVLVVK